jgi:hyperosmotically inducible protein
MTKFHRRPAWGRLGVLPAAAALLFAVAPTTNASARDGDARIRERIEARLAKAGVDQAGEVHVEVKDGAVNLTGGVLTLDASRRARKAAAKESKQVVNLIKVLPEPRPDADIRQAAAAAVRRYPQYTIFDNVELGVEDGVLLLRGSVREPSRKEGLEDRVARVKGVKEIVNQIRVQPVSFFDDRLRSQLYAAIYGSEQFVQYGIQAVPPIHIVVENGRVTLAGYVSSRVEQAMLGAIAHSTGAFAVDNGIKVDGDSPEEPAKDRTQG